MFSAGGCGSFSPEGQGRGPAGASLPAARRFTKLITGGKTMSWLGWLILIAVVAGSAWLQYVIHKHIQGPSHCIGCGKCSDTGICILTGKPVGPRR